MGTTEGKDYNSGAIGVGLLKLKRTKWNNLYNVVFK